MTANDSLLEVDELGTAIIDEDNLMQWRAGAAGGGIAAHNAPDGRLARVPLPFLKKRDLPGMAVQVMGGANHQGIHRLREKLLPAGLRTRVFIARAWGKRQSLKGAADDFIETDDGGGFQNLLHGEGGKGSARGWSGGVWIRIQAHPRAKGQVISQGVASPARAAERNAGPAPAVSPFKAPRQAPESLQIAARRNFFGRRSR